MKLLLVSATQLEIQPFISHFELPGLSGTAARHEIEVLVTGVGMVATAFNLGKVLSNGAFDLAVNAGIAGAFDRRLQPGDIVRVINDCLAELGAEDGDAFIPVNELGFGDSTYVDSPGSLISASFLGSLKPVSAITVNRIHGTEESIGSIVARLNPQIESMEGAAFFYSCSQSGLPYIQIRSISNYVERRNRENWDIPLAVKNLNKCLIELIDNI
ncbi:futalosine hydrolase [Desertivirga xinjiangensis]|uniref:futalosine hydrolase n=1 Tax=Desertivirga xinjiangensis TaxID=539206 RepID=UPI00210CBF89|nr:futalosine hydrolase [Pedobacter xinjiangensis]